jgi:uncharacterized protein YecE (DUF72 family)
MGKILVGTSGYSYRHWRGVFYPEEVPQKEWLAYYAKHFETVEINATFYRQFSQKAVEGWRDSVPEGFRFTLKGHRFVTHVKRLHDVEDAVRRFCEEAGWLGESLSCVLWQLPGSFVMKQDGKNRGRLEAFVKLLPARCHQAIELRHASWFVDDVFRLLDEAGVGFVINDSPTLPSAERVTGRCAYVRFHGPGARYGSSYDDEALAAWAKKVRGYRQERDVYCYFNNDVEGYAVENAMRLAEFVRET